MGSSRRPSNRGGRIAYARLSGYSNGGAYPLNGSSGGTKPGSPQNGSPRAWARIDFTRCLCGTWVVLPWLILALLLVVHTWGSHSKAPKVPVDLPGAKQCVGWRETYFCHPFA